MTVIDIQRKHFNYINHYLPDPSMWLDILTDKTVHHYVNRVRSKALELNSNLKYSSWFAELFINLKASYFDLDLVNGTKAKFNEILIEKR